MIRRINFTGRRRLRRRDVNVRLADSPDGLLRVHVRLELTSYDLPAGARIFLEAYRQTSWQRFDLGTVKAPSSGPPPVLSGFGTSQGVRFRVRVVEPEGGVRAPRILALADDLRPVVPPGGKGGLSLLPVDWGELEGHTWKLEIDPESGPLLRVSRTLVPDRETFVGSREFVSLVLPALLRSVLERALLVGGDEAGEDVSGWAADWLRMARGLPGVGAPPERGGEDELSDEEEDWLDEVVESFSRRNGVPERFAAWWSAGSA